MSQNRTTNAARRISPTSKPGPSKVHQRTDVAPKSARRPRAEAAAAEATPTPTPVSPVAQPAPALAYDRDQYQVNRFAFEVRDGLHAIRSQLDDLMFIIGDAYDQIEPRALATLYTRANVHEKIVEALATVRCIEHQVDENERVLHRREVARRGDCPVNLLSAQRTAEALRKYEVDRMRERAEKLRATAAEVEARAATEAVHLAARGAK